MCTRKLFFQIVPVSFEQKEQNCDFECIQILFREGETGACARCKEKSVVRQEHPRFHLEAGYDIMEKSRERSIQCVLCRSL